MFDMFSSSSTKKHVMDLCVFLWVYVMFVPRHVLCNVFTYTHEAWRFLSFFLEVVLILTLYLYLLLCSRSKCHLCCTRIEQVTHPALKSKCIEYQKAVNSCMRNGDYIGAKVHADTLLVGMYREKWYRMLHAHLRSVREQIGYAIRKPSDIPTGTHPSICAVIFSVPLVSEDLREMKDIGKTLVKLCGKEIDRRANDKGYTQKLLQGKHKSLHFVDVNMVSSFPGGNWQVSPAERHDLVLNMCQARKIEIRDKGEFRQVMLGGVASSGPSVTSSKTASIETIGPRKTSQQMDTPSSSYSGEKTFEEMFVDGGKKKGRQRKNSQETWQTVFDKQQNVTQEPSRTPPPPPSVVTTHDGWEFAVKGEHDSPGNSGGGAALPPVLSVPYRSGWSPPKPKLDDTYSFGRKLDNITGFMKHNSE